eukprot:scaffold91666_cov20-Tisochrysis_lutea.AAC.2
MLNRWQAANSYDCSQRLYIVDGTGQQTATIAPTTAHQGYRSSIEQGIHRLAMIALTTAHMLIR